MSSKLFVAVSGGADSTATALLLHERGIDFEMCFADTGAEFPEVYWLLPRLAAYVGKPLHVVSGGGFFQHLTARGFLLPSPRIRYCTSELKQQPQDRFYKAIGAEEIAVGIRADEPRRLRGDRVGLHYSYPLAEAGMDKAAVKALCAKHDLLNPLYDWRHTVSCFCCFFQPIRDWRGLWRHHPTLFTVAEEWEKQSLAVSGFGWRSDKWTLEKIRQREQCQGRLDLWPDVEEIDEEPCLICAI
jgi:hypothetical protein